MNPVETYLSELRDIRSYGAAVEETSYYGTLETLLNEIGKTLKPKVRCIINLKNAGAGIPDGGLFTPDQKNTNMIGGQTPSRGAVEVKGIRDEVETVAESEQVEKYLRRYGQVLVTNYRDFILVGRDAAGKPEKLESFRLAENETDFRAKLAHPQKLAGECEAGLTEYLKRVMLQAAALTEPKDLAWLLASYARTARNRVEKSDLPALDSVRTALEEALGLKFEGEKGEHFFRSTLVQTLFYGVFSAWVLWHKENMPVNSTQRFGWRMAQWTLHVPMIRALFEQVATPSKLEPLGLVEVLNWAESALNRVDRLAFFEKFEEAHAVQYFYEPFLEAFDPELRKELGVWYTPPEIVEYMVERVDTVLREELHIESGLADPQVYVLDPACGTGAYLVQVLRRIERTLRQEMGEDAAVGADIKKAAMERVFGFEILPAPFVIAHLQLGLILKNLGADLSDEKSERAGVYLTNSLTGWEPPTEEGKMQLQQLAFSFPELREERDAALRVKQEVPILVVIGNPPYNGFAGVSPAEEQGLVAPYKQGLKEWGITKNYLDDLYVRFFRLAERKIAEYTRKGVICYISNFSYLSDPSFVVMRQRFLREFNLLWVDCLNGDSRQTGKLTPDGKPDPSVFTTESNREGIRVGTAVSLMVRTGVQTGEPVVRFRDFWGISKKDELLRSRHVSDFNGQYRRASPRAENRFSLKASSVTDDYYGWVRLADIAAVGPMLGLNDNRGQALQDIKHDEVSRRMRAYYDATVSFDDLASCHPGLVRNAASFNALEVRKRLLASSGFSEGNIRRFWFKPFDKRWAYIETIGNLWNRVRPDLLRQAWQGSQFIMTRRHAPTLFDGAPMYFSRHLSDQHALSTDAYFIPVQVLTSRKSGDAVRGQEALFCDSEAGGDVLTANLSCTARDYLALLGVDGPGIDADAEIAGLVWMHALAIGYSPAYLRENADGIRQDWPRIPLPNTKDALLASAGLGKRIAALLDTENPVSGVTAPPVRPELKVTGVISREGGGTVTEGADFAVTAGWGHAGKDGVTMPGQGRYGQRDYTPDERATIEEGAANLGLTSEEAFRHLGETTFDVYLNEIAYWRNVPAAVWNYHIGGYQVIKKWLSYREEKLLGRPLTLDEVREVSNMMRRITAIVLLQPALDRNYETVKASTYPWPAA